MDEKFMREKELEAIASVRANANWEDGEEEKEKVKLNRSSTFDEEMDKFLIEGFSDRISKNINPISTRIYQ